MAEEKKLTTAQYQRKIVEDYYEDAARAQADGRLTAWTNGVSAMEIFYAHDIIPILPESDAAICAAKHVGVPIQEAAEARDYSPDLCSYARNGLGQAILRDDSPGPHKGLPRPDFLVTNNNSCITVTKWWEEMARIFDAPLFVIDIPFIHEGEQPKEHLQYIITQLKELISLLEDKTGRKFDHDRLKEVLKLSKTSADDWHATLALSKRKPTPLTCFDAFTNLAPMVCLRGTQECVNFYKMLRVDMEAKAEAGIGAIPNERFRLYWDNIACWFKLRDLRDRFAAKGGVLVAASYTHDNWKYLRLDPERALETMALEISDIYINRGNEYRLDFISRIVDEYDIDGTVFHSARTCKPFFLGQYRLLEQVAARKGVPGIVIEGDMTDERLYSDEQANTRIDAFLETLAARRAAG